MFPNGHFYSTIPDISSIQKNEDAIFNRQVNKITGIDLNKGRQMENLISIFSNYQNTSFQENKTTNQRYYYINPAFSYSDAMILFTMIKTANPKRIIEVGSGYSSALMLDINQNHFQNSIQINFIEPYPELLNKLITEEDRQKTQIHPKTLQEIDLSLFQQLEENDILFIDSSHVSKIDSDVNKIIFSILPILKKGVYIHFHDIFFPFEYPKEWLYEGRYWNENYILRAFLQDNPNYQIEYFSTYISLKHSELIRRNAPLCQAHRGSSFWMKKI
jgi:predicted O-methyltransferase YrrM